MAERTHKRKEIDPELKEGIAEVVKAMDAIAQSDFPETIAALMFRMREEFVKAGFTPEEAHQLILAHGVKNLQP